LRITTLAVLIMGFVWSAPQPSVPVLSGLTSFFGFHSQAHQRHQGWSGRHQDDDQPPAEVDCKLAVPANPLSAQGLATPYLLFGTDDEREVCHESNVNAAAFVQGVEIDPATGAVGVYDPVVVDPGTQPAVQPVVPKLPGDAVVGVWIGFNGNNLQLVGPGASSCIEGIPGSIFGQNAFCNATAFYQAANAAIQAKKLAPPPLGTAKDGRTCPSSRDFSLVDQDQSDNTTTLYLVTEDGQIAQDTPQARQQLPDATVEGNGSDEGLLDNALDQAIGCQPWMVPDLADTTGTQKVSAWPLNELQAAADQAPPVALIPALDPFTLVDGVPNLDKLNAYRAGTDQPQVSSLDQADTRSYCENLLQVGLPRIVADEQYTEPAASPMPTVASNLFTFIANRFQNTFSDQPGFLHCPTLLGVQNPVSVETNDAGVVVNVQINLDPPPLNDDEDSSD
jgi:hypothetical protein